MDGKKKYYRSSECPAVYNDLGSANNPISLMPFEQIVNIAYDLHSQTLIDYLSKSDIEYRYNGFSSTQSKITQYNILLSILKLYIYTVSVDENITNWNDFVKKYDLAATISKLNCDGINYKQLVNIIDECFNGIPYKVILTYKKK